MAVFPSASLGCQRVQVLLRLAGAQAIPGIYTSWAPSLAFHRVGALQSAPVFPGRTLCHLSTLVGLILTCPSWWVSPSAPGPRGPLPASSDATSQRQ